MHPLISLFPPNSLPTPSQLPPPLHLLSCRAFGLFHIRNGECSPCENGLNNRICIYRVTQRLTHWLHPLAIPCIQPINLILHLSLSLSLIVQVKGGNRLVLTISFSCDKKNAIEDPSPDKAVTRPALPDQIPK